MGKMIIDDSVPGATGEYQADLTYFTNRELHVVKQETGLVAGDLTEAITARKFDNDVIVAFALTILNRLNKSALMDLVWEAKVGAVTFDFDDEEAAAVAADPPSEIPTVDAVSVNGRDDSSDTSGDSSRVLLALPANDPSRTGSPG